MSIGYGQEKMTGTQAELNARAKDIIRNGFTVSKQGTHVFYSPAIIQKVELEIEETKK